MSIPPSIPHSEDDMTDRMFAQLKPVELDNVTDEAHQRRRAADLARAIRSSPARSRDRSHVGSRSRSRSPHPPWRHWMSRRKPIFFIASTVTAGVAAAAIILPGALSGGASPVRPPALSASETAGHLAARKFLLAAATTTMKEPMESGRYWYTKSQMIEKIEESKESEDKAGALTQELVEKLDKLSGKPDEAKALTEEYRQRIQKVSTEGRLLFSASHTSPMEVWYPREPKEISRWKMNPQKITFASPADEEKWKEMGSPTLKETLDKSHTQELRNTSPYGLKFDGEAIPTDKSGLEKWLREQYEQETKSVPPGEQKRAYKEWLFDTSVTVLGGPFKPDVRAALFQILAEHPEITSPGKVTDSLGRTGVALVVDAPPTPNPVFDSLVEQAEFRLIIDEKTAELLAFETRPAGQSTPVLQQIYENTGWVDKIGDIPED